MEIPVFTYGKAVKEDGAWTDQWLSTLSQLFTNMQQDLSNEGYVIPSVSSNPSSIDPPATGGQLLQVQNSFGQQNGAQAGTLIFDPYEINGGSSSNRLGQLKILLNDGIFHPVTNT
jgi:hypothetical protein